MLLGVARSVRVGGLLCHNCDKSELHFRYRPILRPLKRRLDLREHGVPLLVVQVHQHDVSDGRRVEPRQAIQVTEVGDVVSFVQALR